MKDNYDDLFSRFDYLPDRGVDGMFFCKRCGKPASSRSYQCLTSGKWIIERVRCHLGCGQVWKLEREVEREKVILS